MYAVYYLFANADAVELPPAAYHFTHYPMKLLVSLGTSKANLAEETCHKLTKATEDKGNIK